MRLLTGTPRELDSGNSVTSTKRCQVHFLGSWQSLKSSRLDDGKLFSFPHCLVATHFRADTFYSEHKSPRIIKPGNSSRWPNLKSFSGDGNRGSGVARDPGSASSCSPVRRTWILVWVVKLSSVWPWKGYLTSLNIISYCCVLNKGTLRQESCERLSRIKMC